MSNSTLKTATASPARIALAFAGIYLIWGTTYLAIAVSIDTLPPFTSGALRFLMAAAMMFLWLRGRSTQPLKGISWRWALICGVLLTGFGNGLVVWAQQGVPSGIAALVVASIPVFVLAIDWMFFQRRAPTVIAALGIAMAVVGVAAVVTHTHTIAGKAQPMHIAAILLAVLAWSAGTLLQKRAVRADQVVAFTCAQIFFGGLLQLLLATLNSEWNALDVAQVSLRSILAVSYLIVFGSIVALNCYSWLLAHVPAQKVSTYALVNPIVALLLGAWLLDERITPTVIGSVLLVLFGVSLVLFQDRVSSLWRRAFKINNIVTPVE
ncbi:MAG: EamA family transporter [Candidatus Obscuribacterales bacterium]|nr:EamA family transporter [Steroidobacteraceae bacterium]